MGLRTRRGLALLASGLFVAAACGPGATQSPSATATPAASTPAISTSPSPSGGFNEDMLFKAAAYNPDTGKPGGSVVVSDWQSYTKLNPWYTSAFKNFQVMAVTMYALWTISPDGKWVPQLATKVPRLSDGSITLDSTGEGFTINLEMKPGLLWSDGTPLTMNDWKFTWQWILDPGQVGLVSGTTGWDLIDKFDVSTDGLKATVHYKKGYAGYYGDWSTPPLQEKYMKTFKIADAPNKSYPVGSPDLAKGPTSGPFKYGASSADTLELLRNDNFKSNHTAYLDKIIFKFYDSNKDGMITAFLNKEVDVATDLLQGDYASVQKVDTSYGQALIGPAWEYEHLDLQENNAAFKDPKVREAIAHAIDKDTLWKTVYPGVPQLDTACAPAPPGLYWRKADLTCAQFDVAKAKSLLADAGYTAGADGMLSKGGKALVLNHCSTAAPFRKTGGATIAKMLKDVGIKVNETYDPVLFEDWSATTPQTKCNIYRGTYDTAEFAYVFTLSLFGDYYYSYHSSQIPTDANKGQGSNTIRVADPTMDKALDDLFKATDPAKQFELGQTVQTIYAQSNFEIPLYYRAGVRGVSNRLGNFVKNPSTASDMWNTEDWYIKS